MPLDSMNTSEVLTSPCKCTVAALDGAESVVCVQLHVTGLHAVTAVVTLEEPAGVLRLRIRHFFMLASAPIDNFPSLRQVHCKLSEPQLDCLAFLELSACSNVLRLFLTVMAAFWARIAWVTFRCMVQSTTL